jgi:hypothetical protein
MDLRPRTTIIFYDDLLASVGIECSIADMVQGTYDAGVPILELGVRRSKPRGAKGSPYYVYATIAYILGMPQRAGVGLAPR